MVGVIFVCTKCWLYSPPYWYFWGIFARLMTVHVWLFEHPEWLDYLKSLQVIPPATFNFLLHLSDAWEHLFPFARVCFFYDTRVFPPRMPGLSCIVKLVTSEVLTCLGCSFLAAWLAVFLCCISHSFARQVFYFARHILWYGCWWCSSYRGGSRVVASVAVVAVRFLRS